MKIKRIATIASTALGLVEGAKPADISVHATKARIEDLIAKAKSHPGGTEMASGRILVNWEPDWMEDDDIEIYVRIY